MNESFPVLQAALDFLDLDRALAVAREAADGGAEWLEAGTPLIKSEGLEAVRRLRAAFPRHTIVADLKTMDAGRIEVEAAAKAGADVVVCLAAASPATVAQCVEAAARYNVRIFADTLNTPDPAAAARAMQELGVDYVGVHLPVDDQMRGGDARALLRAVRAAVTVPVAVAGGVTTETLAGLADDGADILIVGGAIHKAPDARAATAELKRALATREARPAAFGRRGGEADLATVMLASGTSNLSDALHHAPAIRGITARIPGARAAGPAFTVRALPGDWNHPVRAIDAAPPGAVLVVDAAGVPPALWGGLATRSALRRGLAGVVVHGYTRDTGDLREMGFPVWSVGVCPDAGEPKGLGEIGGTLTFGGQTIRPGDWILADDDGVMVVAAGRAVEYANRARDVVENETRLRAEIDAGSSLAKAAHLEKWEVRR